MSIARILILVPAILASASAAAQTSEPAPPRNPAVVYKCPGADGSMTFSDRPCSTDPKKMQQVDTSGALRTGSGGHLGEIADSVADSDCRNHAHQSAYAQVNAEIDASNQHIAEYQKRLNELSTPGVYMTDIASSAADEALKQSTIADLDLTIRHEREFQVKANANAASAYQAALDACVEQQAQRAKAAKDKQP